LKHPVSSTEEPDIPIDSAAVLTHSAESCGDAGSFTAAEYENLRITCIETGMITQ